MFQQIFDPSIPNDNLNDILNYFVRTFSRMRGIDIIRCMMSTNRKIKKITYKFNPGLSTQHSEPVQQTEIPAPFKPKITLSAFVVGK